MPTVPFSITNSQQGGINSSVGPDHINQFQTLAPTSSPHVQTSAHGETPTSSQNNTIGEGEVWNLQIFALPRYVSLSRVNLILMELIGQKEFYWDPSIDSEVKILWHKKAGRRYIDFISCIKKEAVRPKYVLEETWESWMRFWKDPKVIENSKINSRNRCGGQNAVAKGTHTGGSITIGEHRKRLAIAKSRDSTPSELHLQVHTHGHDEKSFVGERVRIVYGKYLEIL
ncbi:hypothetical protein KY290_031107 [Solanum tuberosum]|uniref:Uncharacterized protein n=1 Tax=Solanum tuberosum TaxID=4113 RepID=A0ABQ7U929_SOLTU|nr:hypothetical protein KY290_031107 [Solanum tuberosum]